jgi:asparagine synthase (glutamine-hydrolysing)
MADVQAHRGPDGSGVWCDADAGVGLAHRRLAILDLSERGRQPMLSRSGRFVIAFNGEVFNHAALRLQLAQRGHRFSGHSDTEVILAAAEEWGIKAAVSRFIGMFAIVFWDRLERRLTLVRDRLGIKPLYYTFQNGMLAFGSELKALRQVPGLDFQIDRNSAWNFIRKSYVPASNSIYQDVFRLPPGHVLDCSVDDTVLRDPCLEAYWSVDAIRPGSLKPSDGEDALAQLDALLKDAISLRLLADVPVGLFLSGGIDSSLVCALAQSLNNRPLNTFSIGFMQGGYDEARHARAIARHIGAHHTEAYVSEADALDVIPQLPVFYDEPFADSSQIPTLLLSRMARQHVVVALSGDGGDELFGGYDRYFLARHIVAAQKWFPRKLVSAAATALLAAGPSIIDGAMAVGGALVPGRLRKPEIGSRLVRYADCLLEDDPAALYDALTTRWRHVNDPLALGASFSGRCVRFDGRPDLLAGMTRVDLEGWLPDDILTKLDRASMAVGLEARVPLLDHRVVEFAVGLPSDLKVRNGEGKWILRRLLSRYVPARLWQRPKHGFEVPLSQWLRGRLVRWAARLVNPERLRREALLDPLPVARCWEQHQSGRRDWSAELWNVLMFQAWLEHNHPELARP